MGDGGLLPFVVPELTAGSYELVASCELEPDVPSVSFAVFTVIPDTATAKQVKVLIAKIEDLRTALQEQAPTEDATAALLDAVSALPC